MLDRSNSEREERLVEINKALTDAQKKSAELDSKLQKANQTAANLQSRIDDKDALLEQARNDLQQFLDQVRLEFI